MAREFRLFLDGDLGADRQEDGENKNGNSGDPVAFLPQAHGFHAKSPVLQACKRPEYRRNLTAQSDL
ncbi:hypothetical protein GCM10023325_17120 [Sphingomonas lutea]